MKKTKACSTLLALYLIFGWIGTAQSQNAALFDTGELRSFIVNQGQFDQHLPEATVLYGFEGNEQRIFLSSNTVYFDLYQFERSDPTPLEKEARKKQKQKGFSDPAAFAAFASEGNRPQYTSDLLTAEWVNANPNCQLVPEERDDFTHTYEFRRSGEYDSHGAIPSFQKITYQNLYPNIDVEYTLHPESGVKYNLILHPGADLSQVKLRYSKTPILQPDGSLLTATTQGNVIDHPPYTFELGTQLELPSAYVLNGNNISFSLPNYDNSKTIVIDPWTDLPNDPGSNWNCAWECETDALGNAYAIFGVMPLQLRKYNAAGVIQWTYNTTYDSTAWLGTFVTDDAGNSFVTNGSTAALRRVSPAGGLVWSVGNISGMLLGEFWNIAFNCDQTKLIVGGTGGGFIPQPFIFDVDMANGNLLGSVQVHQDKGLFDAQEVRGITATENGKYYWLTHDSIGYVSENFANCPVPSSELIANNTYNLGYKCENWRYNNTGIEAMAYFGGFVFVNRGNRLDKRDFATGAIVTSAAIPGGAFNSGFGGSSVENSGIVVDNAGRVFVGSRGSVSEFDANLNLINTYPVTGGYNVYDVDLTSSGRLIACGGTGNSGTASRTGTVESLGVLGAGPYTMTCCDASICQVGALCTNSNSLTLSTTVGGGTWTSSAPGFNPATGVFDPAVAGAGTYTFYYSLACGIDSLSLNVDLCPTLEVCRQANGDLLVSNGTAPYTWEEGTQVTNCIFGPGSGCNFLTHAVPSMNWTQFSTGTSVTPPVGADTIRIFDATLGDTIWEISSLPPCGVLPVNLAYFTGQSLEPGVNELAWGTNWEHQVDEFTLQSSSDGENWQVIATSAGKGNSQEEAEYQLIDEHAFTPITYYRLGETDQNNTYQPLSTIEVYAEQSQNLIFNVHPNPAHSFFQFTYGGNVEDHGPLTVRMIDQLGKVVAQRVYSYVEANAVLRMEVEERATGMYQVCFSQGGRSVWRKILVVATD